MYAFVVGCGKIGYQLTRALLGTDAEVVAIERNARRSDVVNERLGSVVLTGDGSDPAALQEAGINRCDVLIATTGVDADNLVACQVAKEHFQVPRTIAVVNDPQHVPLFESLGVSVTINTTDLILAYIEEELPAHPPVHVLPLAVGGRQLVGVKVPSDSAAVGRSINDLPMPPDTTVAVVIGRDGQMRALDSNPRLEPEDEVVAVTTPEHEEQLWQALTSGR